MKQPACPKLWQVEAIRDRKLTGQLLAEARAHLANCTICSAENEALAALQGRLKTPIPINEVALRRLRGKMLAAAHARIHSEPGKRPVAWLALAIPIAIVAAALLVGGYWPKPASRDYVQLQGSTGAVWTRTSLAGVEYIDLADGLINITVNRRPADPRLIVRVPDGEVEDTGTRFRVWVGGGRTREVAVETGSVVYRRADGNSIALRAGAVWRSSETPDGPVAAAPVSPMAVPPPPAPSAVVPPPTLARAVASGAVTPSRLGAPVANGRRVLARDPSNVPSEASNVPNGATDEDLAYLQIVALLHEARDEEARLLARDYLRRYPGGFRRVEVSKLLESPTPTPTP